MSEPSISGISEAVVAAGNQSELARQLGVTAQAVGQWVKRGWAPTSRIVEIETLYGIPRVRLINPRHLTMVAPIRFES